MTEAEWLVCFESEKMSDHLFGRVSERRLMLFACACCMRISNPETTPSLSQVIRLAYSAADGNVTREELVIAAEIAQAEQRHLHQTSPKSLLYSGITLVTCGVGFPKNSMFNIGLYNLAAAVAQWAVPDVAPDPDDLGWGLPQDERWRQVWRKEKREQASLAREIFGNPFRPIVVDPVWSTSTVNSLAEAIYADRAFDRLPILADALQDAGCDNDDILNHLRSEGPHVRGCWALDLILGKE